MASWEHLFISLDWFVCVGFGCLLFVGFCWGFFACLGGFFCLFLVRGVRVCFLYLILGQLFSHETQESISVVWCKMTPL